MKRSSAQRRVLSSEPRWATSAETQAENDSSLRWAVTAAFVFFILKLPISLVQGHAEEFRDFDAYRQTAHGLLAYRDYLWSHGPLSPLGFGALFYLLPEKLLTLRLAGLVFWSIGTAYLTLLFSRYLHRRREVFLGILLTSGLFAYPNETFSHIPATVGLIACVYHLLCYLDAMGANREPREQTDLMYSFAGLMVCFLSRPVWMGYGALVAWLAFFASHVPMKEWKFWGARLGGAFAGCGLVLWAIYGNSLRFAFFPPTSMLPRWSVSPDVAYLLPINFHFFVWPTLIFTWAKLTRGRIRRLNAAAWMTVFALAVSMDLFRYNSADAESVFGVMLRGQYVWWLTACAWVMTLWPGLRGKLPWQMDRYQLATLAMTTVMLMWSYLPYFRSAMHLSTQRMNPYGYAMLDGIFFDADRGTTFEAVEFINGLCTATDGVAITQSDPWAAAFIRCKNVFARVPAAYFDSQAMARVLDRNQPDFFFMSLTSPHLSECEKPGWAYRDFGPATNGRRVCWRLSKDLR